MSRSPLLDRRDSDDTETMFIEARRRAVLLLAFTLLAACSSSDDSAATTPADSSTPSTRADVTMTPAPSTTALPTTTAAATTTTIDTNGSAASLAVPEVLEPPADPLAWESRSLGNGAVAPCCAEEWDIGTSPPLGPPDGPLADGVYPFAFQRWNPEFKTWTQDPDDLAAILEVQRFESCALDESQGGDLPLGCEAEWSDDAIAVDVRFAIQFPKTIDENVVVGYTAPSECAPDGQDPPGSVQYVTTGAGYSELTSELANDYAAWIGSALGGPSISPPPTGPTRLTEEQVLERLRTDPASPFVVEPCGVRWTSSRGIPVLLQSLSGPGAGWRESWQLTFPVTLQAKDGLVMLYVGGYSTP